MKYLIFGLGNIGDEYRETRHNIGFHILDKLATEWKVVFEPARYSDKTEFRFKGKTFHLVKPTTYMNRSGNAVRYWINKLGLQPEHILVVVDDKDLPFGKLRLRKSGAEGGHNGLASIQDLLGTKDYPRLRFGIGNDFPRGMQVDHVLGAWSEEETAELDARVDNAVKIILSFGTIGVDRTMNEYN